MFVGSVEHNIDLTLMRECDTAIVNLPNGRLIELEWLDGENYSIKVRGFESLTRYIADETYRLLGYEPQLRSFNEYIRMTVFEESDIENMYAVKSLTLPPSAAQQ